ncbi:radical SAM protein, partial [Thermodesulfobacteriota bacterium]
MSCLYLHIPFCRTKCQYCSFNSQARLDSLYPRYNQALIAELLSIKSDKTVLETLFIGGGTPTVMNVLDLAALVET